MGLSNISQLDFYKFLVDVTVGRVEVQTLRLVETPALVTLAVWECLLHLLAVSGGTDAVLARLALFLFILSHELLKTLPHSVWLVGLFNL